MKIEEPKAMQEIHKIRETMWSENKHLTYEEQMKIIKDLANKFIKEANLEDRVVCLLKKK